MCVIFQIRVAGKKFRTTMMGVMFHLRVTEGRQLRATTVCILFQFSVKFQHRLAWKQLRALTICVMFKVRVAGR